LYREGGGGETSRLDAVDAGDFGGARRRARGGASERRGFSVLESLALEDVALMRIDSPQRSSVSKPDVY
jgi:hypothetical protein